MTISAKWTSRSNVCLISFEIVVKESVLGSETEYDDLLGSLMGVDAIILVGFAMC